MKSRIAAKDRQFILSEMLALARYLTGKQIPAPQVREAVKRLRDDLTQMIREGAQQITVDRESYLPASQEQQP